MAAHLEREHPLLGALEVRLEHLCGMHLSSLSAAQRDAAEAFHATQLRALAAATLDAAVAHARAQAAEEAERAALLRAHAAGDAGAGKKA